MGNFMGLSGNSWDETWDEQMGFSQQTLGFFMGFIAH